MKRIIYLAVCTLLVLSCTEKYEYNADFTAPTELSSPTGVILDVTSSAVVVLEWNGGGAADGSIVQYEVLFVAGNGNFDTPLEIMQSDLGALPKLTLTHAQLNTIARRAGIAAESTGDIKWTVRSSKGGTVKTIDLSKTITITRGEGIDNIPETLYLFGTGTAAPGETEGRVFRTLEEGVYHIYTNLTNGDIIFRSSSVAGEGFEYYGNNGKLSEGSTVMPVTATSDNNPVRIIVDFNTLSVKIEVISDILITWGHGQSVIVNGSVIYQGEGVFKATGVEVDAFFTDWGWEEDRYRFTLKIDDIDYIWGSVVDQNGDPGRPTASTPLTWWFITEYLNSASTPWDWHWKMATQCVNAKFDVYIYTNKDNKMYHEFTNFRTIVDIEHVPDNLYLFGTATAASGETEGRAFRKVANGIFHIYTTFVAGDIKFRSSETLGAGYEYYYVNNKIKEGSGVMPVSATTGNPVRLIVNFNDLSVTVEVISDILITWGHGQSAIVNGSFIYQGGGVFKAAGVEVDAFFTDWGWEENRYRFTLKINGTDYIWGSVYDRSGDSGQPNEFTLLTWWTITEYLNSESDAWDWLWKMASQCAGARFDVYIYTNENNMMYHQFTNFTDI
jgi:hypothetical protein